MTGTGERVDQVISLRFPSYAVRHPAHVCWLVHTMREYYDLWDRFSAGLSPQGRVKERIRRTLIRRADTYFFKHHVKKLFTISRRRERAARALESRERRSAASAAAAARLSMRRRTATTCSSRRDSRRSSAPIWCCGRSARPEARGARCVIGGDGEERPALERLAQELGLGSRVTFAGHLPEAALVDHLARCRAVVFVPEREDYGFVTVEAFAAGKPVITCTDSGGTLELVRAGHNGWVVAPDAASLATAIAEASEDRALAERLGTAGRAGRRRTCRGGMSCGSL